MTSDEIMAILKKLGPRDLELFEQFLRQVETGDQLRKKVTELEKQVAQLTEVFCFAEQVVHDRLIPAGKNVSGEFEEHLISAVKGYRKCLSESGEYQGKGESLNGCDANEEPSAPGQVVGGGPDEG